MNYEEVYWAAAAAYGLGVVGFWLVVWRIGRLLPWRPLRWWLTLLYLCVVLTPWQGTNPEPYLAPAIIVAAFDFMDVGPQASLAVLMPMIQMLVVGTLVVVLVGIMLKLIEMKRFRAEPADPD